MGVDHVTDTCARLERLSSQKLEDRFWWKQADILRALRAPSSAHVYELVPSEHRKRLTVGQWPMKKTIGLVDRVGVERLILRYGGTTPRADLLAALDRGTYDS